MHGGNIYDYSIDIDFSVNLNPCTLSGEDADTINSAMAEGIENARFYPDIRQSTVRAAIAEAEGVTPGQVYAGSGASELIMAVTALVSPKKALLIDPCYSGYEHALSSMRKCNIVRYPLKEEDGLAVTTQVLDALTGDIDIMFIADPVNPTGQNIDEELLGKIFDRAHELGLTVVYDTSFLALSDKADVRDKDANSSYVNKYNNLFILSSYTKSFALPGLRMGYIMSTKQNINALIPYLPEWNLSSVAGSVMKACAHILQHSDHLKRSREFIKNERQYITEALTELGFKVFDSDTVFILVKDDNDSFKSLYDELLKQHILIRKCDDFNGLTEGYYRMAVRERSDNDRLIAAIKGLR